MRLKIKPLSLNQLYPSNRNGRRFLSKEGLAYKKAIQDAVKLNLKSFPDKGYHLPLRFSYTIYGPFLTNKGQISKTAGDLDNYCKPILDAISQELGIDDSCVFKIEANKELANHWEVEFSLVPTDSPVIH